MFPLSTQAIFLFILIGIAFSSALVMRFGLRRCFPLLLLAIILPIAMSWSDLPTGEHASLAYAIMAGFYLAALFLGGVFGSGMRYARLSSLKSVVALTALAGAFAGFALWNQNVPSACLNKALPVRIAGKTIYLPLELRPRLENGHSINFFGRADRKSDHAQLCRMSRNGTRAVKMDTVWITPVARYEAMNTTCAVNKPPAWCGSYSPEPYRRISRFIITSEDETNFLKVYWNEGRSPKKDRKGDLVDGSVCLLSDDTNQPTQCWIWRPYGTNSRLTVRAVNLDQPPSAMSVEGAREMIGVATDMTLDIIER